MQDSGTIDNSKADFFEYAITCPFIYHELRIETAVMSFGITRAVVQIEQWEQPEGTPAKQPFNRLTTIAPKFSDWQGHYMDHHAIFCSTLGLSPPWRITRVDVSKEIPRLDIYIRCSKTFSMPCPSCGRESRVCGSADESWRHGDFFNKEAFLHVNIPVISCDSSCGSLNVRVPWLHVGSRFTLVDSNLSNPSLHMT